MAKFFNITDNFGFFLGGKKRYTKTQIPGQSQSLMEGQPQFINPDNFDAYDIYMTTPEVHAVVNLRGTLLASGVWKHYKRDNNGDKVLVENSDFVKFLENPNALMNGNDYNFLLDQSKSLYGKSFEYVLKGFSSQQIPTDIKILPPNQMKIETTGFWYKQTKIEEIIKEFKYDNNSIPVDEIIYRRIPNANNPIDGESPLKSLYMPISNIREAYKFRNVIMTKRGALGMLTNQSSNSVGAIPLRDTERQRIEKQYQESYGTDDDQSQILISNASLSYQSMSFPTKDLLLFEEVNEDFMRIIDAYGLNINLFSRTAGSTFENLSQGLKQAYQSTIIPEAEELAMNRTKLFGMDSSKEWLELDFSHVPVLQENEVEKSQVLNNKANATQTLVNAGYSLEEVKEIIPFK
tara:strand:+ start:259 stop:1476 length:1218 start_codon:yes stop_codon:yes gene_type:complete